MKKFLSKKIDNVKKDVHANGCGGMALSCGGMCAGGCLYNCGGYCSSGCSRTY